MSIDIRHSAVEEKAPDADEVRTFTSDTRETSLAEAAYTHPAVAVETTQSKSRHLGRYGKAGLGCAGALLAIVAPVAHGIENVTNEPATHVPIKIAGSDVTASADLGGNTIRVTAFGHTGVNYSNTRVGFWGIGKSVGVDVNIDTSNIAKDNPGWTLNATTAELLAKEFSTLTSQKHEVAAALQHDMRKHFLDGFESTLITELEYATLLLLGYGAYKTFSAQEQETLRKFGKMMLPAVAGVLALQGLGQIVPAAEVLASQEHPVVVTPDVALEGTPMQGWEIDGPLTSVFDDVVPNMSSFIEAKNAFYSQAETNFKKAFTEKYGKGPLPKKERVRIAIMMDDTQGMDGPAALVGDAGVDYGADAILIGGDLDGTGTTIETDVADTLYDHAHGIPIGSSLSHHDNSATIEIEKNHHFIVSNDSIQKVGPFSVYGLNDAGRMDGIIGAAQEITPGVTDTDVAKKAINYLCSDAVQKMRVKPIVLVHDSRTLGTPIAQSECVPTVLSGREYTPPQPVSYGDKSTNIISPSTGGHGFNEGLDVWGIIKNPATFRVVFFDDQNRVLSYDTVTTSNEPGAAVTIESHSADDIPTAQGNPVLADGSVSGKAPHSRISAMDLEKNKVYVKKQQ